MRGLCEKHSRHRGYQMQRPYLTILIFKSHNIKLHYSIPFLGIVIYSFLKKHCSVSQLPTLIPSPLTHCPLGSLIYSHSMILSCIPPQFLWSYNSSITSISGTTLPDYHLYSCQMTPTKYIDSKNSPTPQGFIIHGCATWFLFLIPNSCPHYFHYLS